ncbi:fdc46dd0-1cb6-4cfa-9a23-b5b436fc84b1 [Sclerotinia trifoliorum]|uniref:Fdc46dd0-1cb6-4cfa-9a23-b5b436fc84b1 n=1 Tax=Sclerotinia trifoliorum TaxID=28548 RepID=A0A8H2W0E9_9HELO|nr:fdc46dd0-1cb6-4cfa-9a23-b5b436fc84b1 [Sclerotinia trifoliorum]
MEMDLEISPHAGRSEVQSQVPTSPHFQNPMQYLHGACSHCYRDDGRDIRDKQLVSCYQDGELDPFTLFLLTPRWCVDCLAQREMAIRASYCDRLIEMESVEFPIGTVEEAYIRGVHDGRINALSQSFEDCGVRPGEHNGSSMVDDIDEVLRKLTNMGLGTAKSNEDNKIDEIVRDFNDQMMLEDDELKYEVYWHLAYMEGTKDGSYMQAQIEYKALTMDDPERSEMLRRAVL